MYVLLKNGDVYELTHLIKVCQGHIGWTKTGSVIFEPNTIQSIVYK